ncbi:hypothetical protein CDL15_Pgr021899 [Punica granatum]|uniref:Pectinesterase n=1 Tax=Punica granatum TaxID=22663 RepID=A0A218WS95_PUNGR|nr:hypothetical protein CDL15_Pgr021899 [Punica granatum]
MVTRISLIVTIFAAVLALVATANDTALIPADKSQLNTWFKANVKPLSTRKGELDPNLEFAESAPPKVIKVRQDGSGEFKTISEAIRSIDVGNSKRIIVSIGPGVYNERVKIDRTKPFVTLYGLPNNMPKISFNGNAAHFGTVDSATLIVESDYFVAANIIVANSSPRPDGKTPGQQALAVRISGDKSAFYNCRFIGFQDTLCDDRGFHFFKDCYIEGTVDYVFGSGTSLYLNTQLHTLGDSGLTVITAQARESNAEDTGYSFIHSSVTGIGNGTYLGRAWKTAPRVIFAFSDISSVVTPAGWSDNNHPERDQTVVFGEYKNTGVGANPAGRAKFVKQMTDAEVRPFLALGYIVASRWLLPPPKLAV